MTLRPPPRCLRAICWLGAGLAWVSAAAPARAADAPPSLEHALQLYNDIQPQAAAQELRALLATSPPPRVAATCHTYLGLIAMNLENDIAAARHEFELATHADPMVTLPMMAPPKVRMIFEDVQMGEMQRRPKERIDQPPEPTPAAAPTIPTVTEPAKVAGEPQLEAPSSPSLVPAIATGAVAVAALGAGLTCALVSNGTLSQAQSDSTTYAKATALAQTVSQERIAADVLFGASLAAAAVSSVFLIRWWSGPSVAATPLPGGAAVGASASF